MKNNNKKKTIKKFKDIKLSYLNTEVRTNRAHHNQFLDVVSRKGVGLVLFSSPYKQTDKAKGHTKREVLTYLPVGTQIFVYPIESKGATINGFIKVSVEIEKYGIKSMVDGWVCRLYVKIDKENTYLAYVERDAPPCLALYDTYLVIARLTYNKAGETYYDAVIREVSSLTKCKKYEIEDNKKQAYMNSRRNENGQHRGTTIACIEELEEKGFIQVVENNGRKIVKMMDHDKLEEEGVGFFKIKVRFFARKFISIPSLAIKRMVLYILFLNETYEMKAKHLMNIARVDSKKALDRLFANDSLQYYLNAAYNKKSSKYTLSIKAGSADNGALEELYSERLKKCLKEAGQDDCNIDTQEKWNLVNTLINICKNNTKVFVSALRKIPKSTGYMPNYIEKICRNAIGARA